MSKDFHLFAKAVNDRYTAMLGAELHVVDATDIFSLYLASFPEGSNPIFRERTEHDCACCKSFVRHIGHVVRLNGDGTVSTVWDDLGDLPEPYATVGREMRDYVLSRPVRDIFRTKESKYGAQQTHELIDGSTHTWNHFWAAVPAPYLTRNPEAERGTVKTNIGVFKRGLESILLDAVDQVVGLIEANALYRGTEHLSAVNGFRALLVEYNALGDARLRQAFLWQNIGMFGALIRNTVIGTLLTDLSDGVDLDKAVRSFEQKVAPMNYKRTTALITPKMIENGLAKLAEMGLESAIERRHAKISDITVNNVLWVNNDAKGRMKGGLAGLLMESAAPVTVDVKGAVPISMEAFLKDVLPSATSVELLLENQHLANFMSITAPVDPKAGRLFKWDNNFAWSYDGDATDSIKARVKKAGGNIDATLRVSLSWFNRDDLDLHATDPNGRRIHFANKEGILDVDMNAFSNIVRDPVENLAWAGRIADGVYHIAVNSYRTRETSDVGFVLEVENNGIINQFVHEKAIRDGHTVQALQITVKDQKVIGVAVNSGIKGGSIAQDKWGLTTGQLVPVETLMASPNHWDGQEIGNKHWFFILKDARNPEPVRGIYNEFLKGELEPHRKVFEVLGAKTKAQPAADQLSGVGFSSTRGDTVTVVVKSSKSNRAYAIKF